MEHAISMSTRRARLYLTTDQYGSAECVQETIKELSHAKQGYCRGIKVIKVTRGCRILLILFGFDLIARNLAVDAVRCEPVLQVNSR